MFLNISSKFKIMKKVEAIVQSEVSKQVVDAIRKIGIEGA